MTRPAVVAIDGAAGSGKSTLGRALARSLGLPYINTGLMYRYLTSEALRAQVDTDDGPGLAALASRLRFSLSAGHPPELLIQDRPATPELQRPDVEAEVSHVARHPEVRALMREAQRTLGELGGAVMDGRDIGAVVFADAPLKLYLMADAEARVARRAGERAGVEAEVETSLTVRDEKDARVNPFEPPPGSIVLDTSSLDIDQTLEAALDLVRAHAPELIR